MGLFDKILNTVKQNKKSPYADSSSIPDEEKQYYQPDEYYTYTTFPGTQYERKVVTFDERKAKSYPSKRGLYVAEILLLYYCSKGRYPNPKSGYPGFWWFEYGIRDIGGKLRELQSKGFIVIDASTGKYVLTEIGKLELEENKYVPYVHRSKNKTIENSPFGNAEFNVWSINRLIHQYPNISPEVIVEQSENAVLPNSFQGFDAKSTGDTDSDIEFYKKQVAEGFDGNHPYDRLAIYYRKRKEYDKEIEVLRKAIDVFSHNVNPQRLDRNPKLDKFKARLEKALELQSKQN